MKVYFLSLLTVLSSSIQLFAPREISSSSSSSSSSSGSGQVVDISDLPYDAWVSIARFLSPADYFTFQRAWRGHLECLFRYAPQSEGVFFGLTERAAGCQNRASLPYDAAYVENDRQDDSTISLLCRTGYRPARFAANGVRLGVVTSFPRTTKPIENLHQVCLLRNWGSVGRFSCGGRIIARSYPEGGQGVTYVISILPIADALTNLGDDITAQPYQNFRVELPEGFKFCALVGVSEKYALLMTNHIDKAYHLLRINLENTDDINEISNDICVGPYNPIGGLPFSQMSLSESGQYAVIGNHESGKIQVFDINEKVLVCEINIGPNWLDYRPDVSRLQLSADGKLLLVVGPSGTYGGRQTFSTCIIVYDVASGDVVQILEPPRPALASIICARFVGGSSDILALYYQPPFPGSACRFYDEDATDEIDREEAARFPCFWTLFRWDCQ